MLDKFIGNKWMKVWGRFWAQIEKKSQHILLELDSIYIDKMDQVEKSEVE